MRRWIALALILGAPVMAQAQALNYGAYEQLFGEPVTLSATGTPLRSTDAPADMEIITAEMIRRTGARNIPDILATLAGLDVKRYGASDAEVNAGGYLQAANPRLLVLINGRQVYLDDYGQTPWASLPVQLAEIRQIEVVKGPASALFGFNALSGVVNIVTYDPIDDSVNGVTAESGTQEDGRGSAVVTLHQGSTLGLRLSAGGLRQNEFSTAGESDEIRSTAQSPHNIQTSALAEWRPLPRLELGLETTFSDARYLDLTPYNEFSDASYRTRSFKGDFTVERDFGTISGSAYRNEFAYNSNNGLAGNPLSGAVTIAQLSTQFKPGPAHDVRVSFEYRDNVEGQDGAPGGYDLQIGYRDYALGATWIWAALPDLTLVNSVRADHVGFYLEDTIYTGLDPFSSAYNRRALTEISYNSALVWKESEADTVRLLAARGIEIPSLVGLGSVELLTADGQVNALYADGANRYTTGATAGYVLGLGLQTSTLDKYELSWDHDLPGWLSALTLSVSYQSLMNVLTVSSANQGSSRTLGAEIALHGGTEQWHWRGDFVLRAVKDTLVPSQGPLIPILDFQATTPVAVATFGGGWSNGDWAADLNLRVTSGFTDFISPSVSTNYFPLGADPRRIDAQSQLGGRVAYNVTDNLTLAVTGQQLTQARQTESGGLPVERQVYVEATLHW